MATPAATAPATSGNFDSFVGAQGDTPVLTPAAGDVDAPAEGGEATGGTGERMFDEPAEGAETATAEGDAEGEGDLIHGMKADDILKALRDGVVPDELLDKLRVKLKINGEEVPATLAEYREGAMRLSEYSRSRQKLATDRREFEQAQNGFVQMVDTWKQDIGSARRDLEMLGVPLEKLARVIAEEHVQMEQMTPGERQLHEQNRELRRQHERMMAQMQAATTGAEQTRGDSARRELAERIGRFRPVAFAGAKIPDSPTARTMFVNHLGALWDAGTELTQDMCDMAARATAEELTHMARQHLQATGGAAPSPARAQVAQREAGRQGGQARALPARPASSGAAGGGAPAKGGTVSDFDAYLRKLNGR